MAYDSDFDLQDRLQLLYQQGMKQFLNEDVTYINQEQIDEAFRFLEEDPDATKDTINRYFKQLKFFTNNDFAIIDVHNERLFVQNANVLRSIVQMLQDIRLKSESDEHHNQFLGDMFEGFLDAGVKQSEGQFFTPMPIVKFIINSLPLEQVLLESEHTPKAIDYACGAGHFLTELARQIKPLADKYKKAAISEYYGNITGIEKEYRLSKVAKVSAFMYGQDEIKIMYADALAKNPEIQNGTYNILVANPPYSVKGFLETLNVPEKRSYELFGNIDDKSVITNNSIETFFIERAKQLLAPEGIAAIILPSSILSNDSKIYQHTREILIQHFHIIAIAELGSGTFGKTGTNTVTLFLRRRQINPAEADHYRNRARSWIDEGELNPNHRKNKEFKDLHLLENYCKYIGIDYNNYKNYFQNGEPNESLQKNETWQEYEKAFYARTDIKNHQKKSFFKNLKKEEQQKDLDNLLYRHIREIEKEKLYYFLLAQSNAVPVLIIKSPSDNKAMKKFLGYEWSAAKGSEGIKYLNAALAPAKENEDEPTLVTAILNSIQTPLYNPARPSDDNKLNYYIHENFLGKTINLPESLKEFAHTSPLVEMLDFSRRDFNKAFSLAERLITKKSISKYPRIRIENALIKIAGNQTKIPQSEILESGIYPVVTQEADRLISGYSNNLHPIDDLPLIVFGDHNCTFKFVDFKFVRGADGTQLLKPDSSILEPECFYYLIQNIQIQNREKYERHYKYLSQNFITIPPTEIQQSIVRECKEVDNTVNQAQQNIQEAKSEMEKKVENTFDKNYPLSTLNSIAIPNPSKTEIRNLDDNMHVSFIEMASVSNDGFIENMEDRLLKDVRKGSYTYFAEGDIIIAKITPCMENGKCALAKNLTNGIALGSSEFHVIRTNEKIDASYLFYHLNRSKIRIEAEKRMTGRSGHRRVPISFYESLQIPVPSLPVQEKLVKEIEILEAQIATAQNVIDNAAAKKQGILKKWLE